MHWRHLRWSRFWWQGIFGLKKMSRMLLNIGLKSREIGSLMGWLVPISAPQLFTIPMVAIIYQITMNSCELPYSESVEQISLHSLHPEVWFNQHSGMLNVGSALLPPNYIYSYPKPTVPYYYHFWMLMANKLSFKINYLELIGINQEDCNKC